MGLFSKIERLFNKNAETPPTKELALRQGTAEYEYFIARGELENTHSLSHGLSHLAELLALDPSRPDWVALLDRYREKAGNNLETILPAKDGELYYATEAIRGWELAKQGRVGDALGLLTQVVRAKPDAGYLEAWAIGWVEGLADLDAVPKAVLLHFLATCLNRTPEYKALPFRREAESRRLAALAMRVAKHFPPDPMADMLVAGLHRKSGLFVEGLRYVEGAIRERPTWNSYTALGLLLREQGSDPSAAEAAFRKAMELDPADLSARLEAGDMFFEMGAWTRARAYYEEVLARKSEHPWAVASALWCRWREKSSSAFPDDAFPGEFESLADEGNARARDLLGRFGPYRGLVPTPQDATANVVSQVFEKLPSTPKEGSGGGGSVQLALSDVEGPSNAVAFAVGMRARGVSPKLIVAYNHVATPDPREPVEPTAFALWRRDGEVLVPALPPPSEDVSQRIASLAAEPFDASRSWAAASRVGAALGPSAAEELLRCMVHPPALPQGRNLLHWVVCCQFAAAQVLAHLETGWENSVRRSALYSLLLGPRDWTTESAIVTLAWLATDEPALGNDIREAFEKLDAARPNSGYVAYEVSLLSYWKSLPTVFPNEAKKLEERLQQAISRE